MNNKLETKKPLKFKIRKSCGMARASILSLPHGEVETPAFMPVGTYGAIKGITYERLREIGYKLTLGNTYHLSITPGVQKIADHGGLHEFNNCGANLLTDSGGFQMVSLLKFSEVSEKGVCFSNPKTGGKTMLSPEESIRLQNLIGADIIMAMDDVVKTVCPDQIRMEEACHRTVRWLDRCIASHSRKGEQSLFGIVQGGLDANLRDFCLDEMAKRNLRGYAIGGLAGGEDKESFWKVVLQCTKKLPKDKPRYLMGVGYPLDLLVCSALGCDMYDCVYPARAARFGVAFTKKGFINLKSERFKLDFRPLEKNCPCKTCLNYSREYLRSLRGRNAAACSFLTEHNLVYVENLMRGIRDSIRKGTFENFVKEFLMKMYRKTSNVPEWAVNALRAVGIEVNFD